MAPDVQGRAGGVRALYFSPLKTYLVTYESLEPQKFWVSLVGFDFCGLVLCFGLVVSFFLRNEMGPNHIIPALKRINVFLGP